MKTDIKVAYAYLRVSSQSQIEGDGFRRQEEEIRAFAKRNGIDIAGVFKEGISGTKGEEDRPVFQEMVGDILSNGVNAIIVEGTDRLARTSQVQEQLIIFLTAKKINLLLNGQEHSHAIMPL